MGRIIAYVDGFNLYYGLRSKNTQAHAFDTAILVSGDSDLTRPVQAVQARYPRKRVVVAFPPDRESSRLRQAATAGFVIRRKKLKDSQLPDRVSKPDGHVLIRAQDWR